jgi:hypothetical protein
MCRYLGDFFLQALETMSGTNGVVYMTTSITTGRRYFELLRDLGCTSDELRRDHAQRQREYVIEPNLALARITAEMVRARYPESVVLDPSRLSMRADEQFPQGWSQQDYYDLWEPVIKKYAKFVVATTDWAFSRGSRREVEMGIANDRTVVDLHGTPQSVEDLTYQDQEARNELCRWGWTEARVEAELPPLNLGKTVDFAQPPTGIRNLYWHQACKAVNEDLLKFLGPSHRYTPLADDERTRRGTNAERWRSEKLDKYWAAAMVSGFGGGRAKLELLSLAGVAVGMMRSVVRTHGGLPSHAQMRKTNWKRLDLPKTPTGLESTPVAAQLRADAEVWLWIDQEYAEMSRSHPQETDDRRTEHDPEAWHAELWNEYLTYARFDSVEGRVFAGRFSTATIRLLSSVIRVYGLPPRRPAKDVTRESL